MYLAIYREEGIKKIENEVVIQDSELKSLNFNIKSNNYLLRSYIATESKAQGGYLAIEADKEGYLLEGSVATVAVLLKNGDFVVPPFERILPGTTAIKILDFIENEVIPRSLVPTLKQVVRRDILISEAQRDASEVMFLGGEECVPVLHWDGKEISESKGPAAILF